MKSLLFTCLVLTSVAASAEVLNCPASFPSKDLPLSDHPPGRSGSARLQPARLSNAYMTSGKLYSEVEFVPDITNVKNGRDVKYDFTPQQKNWLVCEYGGGERIGGTVQWWEKLSPAITHCVLKVRELKIAGTASDWSASASCK